MPSTITNHASISPVTQTSLADGIKQAFISLGETLLDDYVSGSNRILVFQRDLALGKIFSKVVYAVTISSTLAVSQTLYTDWNSTAKTGTNAGSVGVAVSFLTSSTIEIKSFKSNSNEFTQLVVWQGLNSQILGWIRPGQLNNIDENLNNAFLIWSNFSNRQFRGVGAAASLSGNNIWSSLTGTFPAMNHYQKADICSKLLIFDNVRAVFGATSEDIAFGSGAGLPLFASVDGWIKVWDGATSSCSIYLK